MNPEMRVCAPPLWFIFFVIIPISITAQQSSNNNVTLGSSIVAKADGSPAWTSPSGEFAFGFRKVGGGGFLLAIWFDRLPDKTIVWSANRNNPVSSGSRIQLSQRGTLELIDERGQPVLWPNYQPQSGTVAYAAMLDTGNFVLATNTSKPLWESFDEPTDTMLPGQTLRGNIVLISSFSETNYSEGRFSFAIKANVAGLRTRNFPWGDSIYDYWLSPRFQSQMIFNQSGNAYAAEENGTMINPLFDGGTVPIDEFLQRLTLEYDGVLRQYVYPKSANRTGGREVAAWSVHDFIPPNICMGVVSGGNGGGICGFNSLCTLAAGRTKCQCPKGYSLIDPADRLSGCKPDFALQSCDPQSNDADQFEFTEFLNTNWPYADYRAFEPVDEDYCRRDCLADCFCALMTYTGGRCWKKPLPFINGRTDPGIPEKALVKVRKNNNTISGAPTTTNRSQSTALVIAGSVLMACSVTLFLISSVLLFVYCYNVRRSKMIPQATVHPAGITTMRSYSFMELQEATNGFKEILGKGAYSTVYRGALTDTGKFIAVKKLHKVAEEADLEFIAEVSSISRTNHKNLVQLLGYCDEGHNRILVYELMANGSLATFLFQKSPRPNWYTRVQIAFATARALCYLHEECSVPIIHCDIKPQNVLLDECFVPKIADFGLAKLMKPDQTRTTTIIRGTRGYVAPEWFRNMPITVKVDVYSFGILLLELLCCRKHYEADLEDDGEAVLADWAYDCYQQGVLDLLVGDDKEARSDMKMFEILVKTAIWCIQEDPTLRPNMKRVMHMLEGSIQVPAPPDPTTFIS